MNTTTSIDLFFSTISTQIDGIEDDLKEEAGPDKGITCFYSNVGANLGFIVGEIVYLNTIS